MLNIFRILSEKRQLFLREGGRPHRPLIGIISHKKVEFSLTSSLMLDTPVRKRGGAGGGFYKLLYRTFYACPPCQGTDRNNC